MPCLVIGDSIAVGVGLYFPSVCEVHAREGAGSAVIFNIAAQNIGDGGKNTVIISVGSNDPLNYYLLKNLRAIRGLYYDTKVIWIEPQHKRAAKLVNEVARENRDAVITFAARKDGVHPRSYKNLALDISRKM